MKVPTVVAYKASVHAADVTCAPMSLSEVSLILQEVQKLSVSSRNALGSQSETRGPRKWKALHLVHGVVKIYVYKTVVPR